MEKYKIANLLHSNTIMMVLTNMSPLNYATFNECLNNIMKSAVIGPIYNKKTHLTD